MIQEAIARSNRRSPSSLSHNMVALPPLPLVSPHPSRGNFAAHAEEGICDTERTTTNTHTYTHTVVHTRTLTHGRSHTGDHTHTYTHTYTHGMYIHIRMCAHRSTYTRDVHTWDVHTHTWDVHTHTWDVHTHTDVHTEHTVACWRTPSTISCCLAVFIFAIG
jgi:hypothetical protein